MIARYGSVIALLIALAGCSGNSDTVVTTPPPPPPPGPPSFANNPCGPAPTVQLNVAEGIIIDCSNGGSTVTLVGNGASYLVVPQFATGTGQNSYVQYQLASGSIAAASIAGRRKAASLSVTGSNAGPVTPQQSFDRAMLARAKMHAASGAVRAGGSARTSPPAASPPTLGSTRPFHVFSSTNVNAPTWQTVTASLVYLGANIYLYEDIASPADGFSPAQLQAFGVTMDHDLYPVDIANFGAPSDVDQNGHVIMLMTPVVNGLTTTADCLSQGFIVGFFDPDDFDGPSNPNSNQGEIFYSVVPDSLGTVSCAHTVSNIGPQIEPTFLHELQHLISFSQHVVVHGGEAESSWLDEGLSIVAEELGSVYYEQKCPPPACRTSPVQLFPDSSQGFVSGFLDASYRYGLVPDTASLTLHSDSELGTSWRGGEWLLMRWLGDHGGAGFYQLLEQGPADGISNIVAATGRPFATTMGNFSMALVADSMDGLPRTTAPAALRFASRNVRQLWARFAATASGFPPFLFPIQPFPISSDTSPSIMVPGGLSYWRLDTPANQSTVSIRFADQGGLPLAATLHPQIAIFRLPAGQ